MVLLMLIFLLVTACGAPEEAKPLPLPEDPEMLRQGTYRSEEFQPSFSFTIEDGWTHVPLEGSDQLASHGDSRGGWDSRTSSKSTSPPRRARQS
jgi:hypothetical protein